MADTTPPSIPTNLTITGYTATSVSLAWDLSIDDTITTAYDVYNGSNVVATITPTQTWTRRAQLPTGEYWKVFSGNNSFLAVGYYTDKALFSKNGITWTEGTLPRSDNWVSAAYGNGTWVALTDNNMVALSSDGINWTSTSIPQYSWYSVAFGVDKFVALQQANNSTTFATSPDGVTWTIRTTLPIAATWYTVLYGGGTWLAVAGSQLAGNATARAATSPDGISWTTRTLSATQYWYGAAYGNGTYFTLALMNSASSPTLIGSRSTSSGSSWARADLPFTANWEEVTYDTASGLFCAVASNDSRIVFSPSANTGSWTTKTSDRPQSFISSVAGFFVATSNSAPYYVSTYDHAPTPAYTLTTVEGNNYQLSVKARDAAGNTSASSNVVAYPPDTTPPEVPTVTAKATGSSVTVSWGTDPDANLYEVFLGGVTQGTIASSPLVQTMADGTYSYTVRARDAAGNWSAQSTAASVTVDTVVPEPPTIPPTPPVTTPGSLEVTIVWDEVPDAEEYEVFRRSLSVGVSRFGVSGGESVGFTTEPTFTDTVPEPGNYGYSISARDAAGNWSEPSPEITASVQPAPPPPDEEVSGLNRAPMTDAEETLGRDPDEDYRRLG